MTKQRSDFSFEQQVYLGGLLSEAFKEYKDFAMMSPDNALVVWFLKNFEKLEGMKDEEALISIMEALGKIEYLSGVSELSHLSMKLGDTRQKRNIKGMKDALQKLRDATP